MTGHRDDLPPPPDLRAVAIDGGNMVILSYPVEGSSTLLDSLSPAERQVAQLVCEGLRGPAIAVQRQTSYRTVCNQLASTYRKLGVNSRDELIALLSCPRAET